MIPAITSVIFGVLTFLGFPLVVPVLGIGLGTITLFNEFKKDTKNIAALCTGIAGLILNVSGVIIMNIPRVFIRTH